MPAEVMVSRFQFIACVLKCSYRRSNGGVMFTGLGAIRRWWGSLSNGSYAEEEGQSQADEG